jgi:hypothetical protein
MGRHQVVFVGETHDDPTGHMPGAELLKAAFVAYGASGSAGDGRAAPSPNVRKRSGRRTIQAMADSTPM